METNVRQIFVPGLPEPDGAGWSRCLLVGREVAISGVTARHADGCVPAGMRAQVEAIYATIARLLAAAGGGMENVYKMVVYVTDMSLRDEVNAARAACLKPLYPCSTLVGIRELATPNLLVEIDAFAHLDIDRHAAAEGQTR